jgi:hypothetical protein
MGLRRETEGQSRCLVTALTLDNWLTALAAFLLHVHSTIDHVSSGSNDLMALAVSTVSAPRSF